MAVVVLDPWVAWTGSALLQANELNRQAAAMLKAAEAEVPLQIICVLRHKPLNLQAASKLQLQAAEAEVLLLVHCLLVVSQIHSLGTSSEGDGRPSAKPDARVAQEWLQPRI